VYQQRQYEIERNVCFLYRSVYVTYRANFVKKTTDAVQYGSMHVCVVCVSGRKAPRLRLSLHTERRLSLRVLLPPLLRWRRSSGCTGCPAVILSFTSARSGRRKRLSPR